MSGFTEADFLAALPEHIRVVDEVHFTPVEVVDVVAEWLQGLSVDRVLDIGSGAGKFCCLAAAACEGVQFVGVERRFELHAIAEGLAKAWPDLSVAFFCEDVLDFDFSGYRVLYMYNPFYEHVADEAAINQEYELYTDAFEGYQNALRKRLQAMPLGTIVIAYHGEQNELPYTYEKHKSACNGLLNMWVKKWIV